MKWSDEEVERCKELWASEMSGSVIAALLSHELGRPLTKNSVICRMAREGLSYCPTAMPPAMGRRPRRLLSTSALEELRASERERDRARRARDRGEPVEAPPRKSRAQKAISKPPPRPIPALAVARQPATPSGIPESLRIPLTRIGHGQCRYICGDPLIQAPALCCGHKTDEGSNWCFGHRKLCTYRAPRGGSFVLNRRGAA